MPLKLNNIDWYAVIELYVMITSNTPIYGIN